MGASKSTSAKAAALALLSLSMVLATVFFLPAAPANAQDQPTFAIDVRVPSGTPCPAGTINVGTLVGTAGFDATWCRPVNFAPIRSQAACDEAAVNAPFVLIWFEVGSVCAVGGQDLASMPNQVCQPPLLPGFGTALGLTIDWCLFPALSLSLGAPGGATLVCIESDFVQNEAAAAGLGVGDEFNGTDGGRYLIHSGEPTCGFNCDDGFDANCDDRLGDFCPIELNVSRVSGVKQCQAFLNPEAAPAAGEAFVVVDSAADAAATSAPAVPVSAPAAAAVAAKVAVSDTPQSLAHTGTESVLGYAGAALVAYGAVALGVTRHLKVRRES